MTDGDFRQICAAHGFGEVALSIRPYMMPCVGFSLSGGGNLHPVASKLGGSPAVPKSFEWPAYCGQPLDFLLQVNLRDVPEHDSTCLFLPAGRLAFLYASEEQPWGYDPANLSFFRVCYFQDGLELSTRPRPDHRLSLPPLAEKGIEFWPAQSLPACGSRPGRRLFEQMKKTSGSFDVSAFDRLSQAVFRAAAPTADGPRHRLGGHSDNIQGDMQLVHCHAMILG